MNTRSGLAGRRGLRHWLAVALGFTVSAACLYAVFVSINVEKTVSAISRADHRWLVAAAVSQVFILVLRALRWRFLFREAVGFGDLFWSQAVGYLASNILPLRVGDLVRFGWLFARRKVPSAEIAFTVLFERFLDVFTLLTLGAAGLALVGPNFVPGTSFLGPVLLILGSGIGAVWALSRLPQWSIFDRIPVTLQRQFREASRCVSSLVSWRGVLLLLLTVLCAAASVAYSWLVIRSLVPDAGVRVAVIVTAAVMVAIAIPAAPGAIGTFHLAASITLTSVFGYPPETAVVISVLLHAVQYIGGSVIGLLGIGLWPGPAFREALLTARHQYAARSNV